MIQYNYINVSSSLKQEGKLIIGQFIRIWGLGTNSITHTNNKIVFRVEQKFLEMGFKKEDNMEVENTQIEYTRFTEFLNNLGINVI